MLTTAKTASSSRPVVPASAEATSVSERSRTNAMSPRARSVVKAIAAHGERRPGSTAARERGRTSCLAIP